VVLDSVDISELSEREMRSIRGDRVGFIFQEPMTSLNPTFTIGFQLIEALRLHRDVSKAEARARALETLGLVGVSAPERRLQQYPHELSGGLRQRVMIAMALICDPQLLIADEPTTALDVTIQAQVLDLLIRLQKRLGMAVLLITHDLGVVAETCQRVIVMYGGRIVETADVRALFERPRHPYTHGLMNSMPSLSTDRGRLQTIPGVVPSPGKRPPGCYFADRCERAQPRCHDLHPELRDEDGSRFACWNPLP
jgi:oligopeptide/dipeptide ABC transporter ATP-binding protein